MYVSKIDFVNEVNEMQSYSSLHSSDIKRKFKAKHIKKTNTMYTLGGFTSIALYISRSDPMLASYVSIAFGGFMFKCSQRNLNQRISCSLFRLQCRNVTRSVTITEKSAATTTTNKLKKVLTNGNGNEILVQVANRLARTCSDHDIARDFDHAWNDKDDDGHARKEI